MKLLHHVKITPELIRLDGSLLPTEGKGSEMLKNFFRKEVGNYPKFFKMDSLCRLGFLASEVLLREDPDRFTPREDRAVIVLSRSGSLCDDSHYLTTIQDDNYYPSPALFVYTLANTVTGEICLRNQYLGDSSSFILEEFDAAEILRLCRECLSDRISRSALIGWIDCRSDEDFEALVFLVEEAGEGFDCETINQLR